MISAEPMLTTAGKGLFMRAVGGEPITFTRFKVGDGRLSGDPGALTDLVHARLAFPITEPPEASESGYLRITGAFDSTMISEDFTWRELGLFCMGEDEQEVLYAYANDGDDAGLLRANATNVQTEQRVSFIVAIGEAENVTAIIAESNAYALKSDFDAHVADKLNPHEVTKAQVGLGNVPNVATNDQTPTYSTASESAELASGERLSTAFGKIARAVKSLISHLADKANPHAVTAGQIGAAAQTHAHAASDITTGTLAAARGGTGVTTYGALRDKLGLGGDTLSPLAVTKGGTGVSSLDALRGSLGLGEDAGAPLSVDHGGTGVTTLDEVRAELGLGDDVSAPLDVEHGGTGLNTQAAFDARVAWPVLTGSYTGDGVKERVISLGFTPRFLIVYSSMGSVANYSSAGSHHCVFFACPGTRALNYNCNELSHLTDAERTHTALEIVSGGFRLYSSAQEGANYRNYTYHYAAFR